MGMGRRGGSGLWALPAALVLGCVGAVAAATAGGAHAAPAGSLALDGRIVTFALNSYQPDGDPVDRVIIAGRLRDARPVPPGWPATMLVLSLYLESFQPTTTPLLPDLLHSDQLARSLAGFMQGKAAMVDGAGVMRYRGSVLAEVFLDNTIHMILDIQPAGGSVTAAALRLRGSVTLRPDQTLAGMVAAGAALPPAGWQAPAHSRHLSWQDVTRTMKVRLPPMMGTAGSSNATAAQRSMVQSIQRLWGGDPVTAAPPGAARPPRQGVDLHRAIAGVAAGIVLLASLAAAALHLRGRGRANRAEGP